MKNIMICGAGGQLGRELTRIIPDSIAVYHTGEGEQIFADISDSDKVTTLIEKYSPEIVINASAIANVDLCEKNREAALSINGTAVNGIANACREIGATLIHISTDYVFDGVHGNYTEKSIPNPINFYGLSKLIGDIHALSYKKSIVVRTSGVFGYSKNFPLFVFETLNSGKPVNAIEGFYSPIHARNLALAVLELSKTDFKGIINISGERISRYELAVEIAKEFGLEVSMVNEVKHVQTFNAKRPFDSSLDNSVGKNLIKFDYYSLMSNLKAMKDTIAR